MTDFRRRIIPAWITAPFFITGALYQAIEATPTTFYTHVLILAFLFVVLFKVFSLGDLKFLVGFSMWNSFATMNWMLLITLCFLLIRSMIPKLKGIPKFPLAPIFFVAFLLTLALYQLFPVMSLIY